MVDQEKHDAHGHEIEDSAAAGHVATDEHGNPLFATDEKAEAKLRRKIDWCIVPPVALLYVSLASLRWLTAPAPCPDLSADSLGLLDLLLHRPCQHVSRDRKDLLSRMFWR